jgi:hypothetical protein
MYMLLFYSVIVSLILFGVIYLIENNNDDNTNSEDTKGDSSSDLLNFNNCLKFVIIFTSVFSLFYFAFDENMDVLSIIGITDYDYSKMNDINKTNIIDPSILRNTTEPMSSGFEPYNSGGSDVSSVSDSSSVADSDI